MKYNIIFCHSITKHVDQKLTSKIILIRPEEIVEILKTLTQALGTGSQPETLTPAIAD